METDSERACVPFHNVRAGHAAGVRMGVAAGDLAGNVTSPPRAWCAGGRQGQRVRLRLAKACRLGPKPNVSSSS